jgi:hypothetical protein
MYPRTFFGVGTEADAGRWSTRSVMNWGLVVASRISREYSASHSGCDSIGSTAYVGAGSGAAAAGGSEAAAAVAHGKSRKSRVESFASMGGNVIPAGASTQHGTPGAEDLS